MNTNSNTYTVIYSIVLVVVVAAILAFAAVSLQPKQSENVKIETISQLLNAAAQADSAFEVEENVMAQYAGRVIDAYYVNGKGEKVKSMNLGKENLSAIEVATTSDLKKQNDIIKQIEKGNTDLLANLELPVYILDINGTAVTVIPCYGAGLWGPIWGYLAVNAEGRHIYGAIFDHKSETPGLGAKIADEPWFHEQFQGKEVAEAEPYFAVVKGGAKGAINAVDAISGATITSQALGTTINTWVGYYQPYFAKMSVPAEKCCNECTSDCGSENCTECNDCSHDCEGCTHDCAACKEHEVNSEEE